MIRFLLDTDHITLHDQGHPLVRQRLLLSPPESIAVSIVTVEETLRGRLAVLARRLEGEALVRAYGKLVENLHFFSSIAIVPFDRDCERRYRDLRSAGVRVGTQDLKIATTGLTHNLIVVTRNRRDFGRVAGLTTEDWSEITSPS